MKYLASHQVNTLIPTLVAIGSLLFIYLSYLQKLKGSISLTIVDVYIILHSFYTVPSDGSFDC